MIGQATPLRFNAAMHLNLDHDTWFWVLSTIDLPGVVPVTVASGHRAPLSAFANGNFEFDGSNFTVTNAEFGDAGKYTFQSSLPSPDPNQRFIRWTAYAVIIGKFVNL